MKKSREENRGHVSFFNGGNGYHQHSGMIKLACENLPQATFGKWIAGGQEWLREHDLGLLESPSSVGHMRQI